MTRPEHVRCENCCYWRRYRGSDQSGAYGTCERDPWSRRTGKEDNVPGHFYCGEFRETWPGREEDDPKAECPCCHEMQPLNQRHACLTGYFTLTRQIVAMPSEP